MRREVLDAGERVVSMRGRDDWARSEIAELHAGRIAKSQNRKGAEDEWRRIILGIRKILFLEVHQYHVCIVCCNFFIGL
jgi:hypothetical protein